MHTDRKKLRSYLASHFATGETGRYIERSNMQFLKITLCLLIILCFLPLAYGDQYENLSNDYLFEFKNGNFVNAARKLHCPEFYSSEEIENDIISISKTLEIFSEEFGALLIAEKVETNLYVTLLTACGTVDYWKSNPPIKQIVYETLHEGNREGYIVLSFSKIDDQIVLSWANHGLPMLGDASIARVKEVFQRIKNK